MTRYIVTVEKTTVERANIIVYANNEDEARQSANTHLHLPYLDSRWSIHYQDNPGYVVDVKEQQEMSVIKTPLIELLAIKLYEHDKDYLNRRIGLQEKECWAAMSEEDRESYRKMARGESPLYPFIL